MGFVKWMDARSRLVKILFCLPIIDIVWWIYRIISSAVKGKILWLILAIVLIITGIGWFLIWILDIICVIIFNHILWHK